MTATASTPNSSTTWNVGHSDFSSFYPWKGIVRETLSTGDVMVKIPKFYYRRYRDSSYEYIQISSYYRTGFNISPAHNRPSRTFSNIYVGAYETCGGVNTQQSISGNTPIANTSIASFRTGAKLKGSGWYQFDIATLNTIQLLYLVEYANNNSQSMIGAGNVNNSAKIKTGGADNVPLLTGRALGTATSVAVVYRGIENLWGNYYSWIDGINHYYTSYYISLNPEEYHDDSSANYQLLQYTHNILSGYENPPITVMGYDENLPWVILPQTVNQTVSTNNYFTDTSTLSADQKWRILQSGGRENSGNNAGIFMMNGDHLSSEAGANIGSRLIYLPQ